jgi:drug/metabolite transporter (DMT)-like permease
MTLAPSLYLLAGMATVGSYVALSKPLVLLMPVFVLAFLRFSLAALMLLPWLPREANQAPLSSRAKVDLFFQSFFGNFLFSVCMLYGVLYGNAVTAGIVMAAIPAAVAALSWLLLRETLPKRRLAAITLSIAAVLVLQQAAPSATAAQRPALGVALLLGAVFCEAMYVVLAKKLSGSLSPKRGSALLNAWGWALTLPFALWQLNSSNFSLSELGVKHWGLLTYYALAASVLSTWLWFTGLRHVPANQAGVYTVALPITAALLGVLVLNEPFTVWHASALALALCSVLAASWAPTAKR